jgi:YggT family protein
LGRITDPYLNAFRRFTFLRIGHVDLSPIAALTVLSLLNQVFAILARHKTIKLGIILSIALQLIWSAASFLLGFGTIILILRLIAYLTNRDVYSGFWRIIDTISQPLLYRINRIFFGKRIIKYLNSLLFSIAALAGTGLVLSLLIRFVSSLLTKLPI